MSDLPDLDAVGDQLGRKVGPLPAWAWAAVAVAGVTAAIVIRRRLSGGGTGAAPEPGADPDGAPFDQPMPYLPGGFVVGGGTQATGSTGGADVPAVPSVPKTNTDWQRDAARSLVARGYQGTVVTDALSRYLGGQTLTSQGQAMIDTVISDIGAPPNPVPPPTVSPQPEPPGSPGGGGTNGSATVAYFFSGPLTNGDYQIGTATAAELAAGEATRKGVTYRVMSPATAAAAGLAPATVPLSPLADLRA